MDNQTQILNAALKLFVEFGFHGTPTSKIATEAGVSNGTLFHYYKTKDELVSALYIDVKNRLVNSMDSEVQKFSSIKEKIYAVFRSTILWALKNQEAYFFIQQVHFSPHVYLISDEIKTQQARIHTELLGLAYSQNLLKPLDPELIGQIVNNQVNAAYQYLSTKKLNKEKQLEVIKTTFKMVWSMIKN